jgi:hypothetical protein
MSNSDEIDLDSLLGKINDFFRSIVVTCFNGINYVLKNWLILLILAILGAGLGYFSTDESQLPQKAKLIVRTNYDSAEYAYSALDLLFEKSKVKDLDFLGKNGFRTDSIEIRKIEIAPIINFNDITSKYDPNDRNLETILKNVDFEEEEDKTNSFKSAYKYHTIEFTLSPAATNETIDNVLQYLNSQKLIKELARVGKLNIAETLERNQETFGQINQILDDYSKGQPLPSSSSQIFVVDKNFNISHVLQLKMNLQEETELLRQELVFADNVIVRLNDHSVFTENPGILGNKMFLYPVFLIFIFLFVSWLRHVYAYLKGIAQGS